MSGDDALTFYVPLGEDRWQATAHTVGPWDAGAQHAGPPSALLGRAMERCAPREEMIFTRFTCEILGPIPVGELLVTAAVARPGRSVELLEATMSAGGRPVARACAWRVLRTTAPQVPARPAPDDPRPQGVPGEPGRPQGVPGDPAQPQAAPDGLPSAAAQVTPDGLPSAAAQVTPAWSGGYLAAIEWRPVRGGFDVAGPAALWTRMRHPLVPGEEPSPLQRVLIIADSGNGISWELDSAAWFFINPELTVHLHRDAVGEWICIDAQTAISPGGTGLATSTLSDRDGPVGVGAQSLYVGPRQQ